MKEPAIDLQQVLAHAGGRRILDLPCLQVGAGSVVTLLGPNGAGKSTLLRVCLGLTRVTSGTVRVLGEDVTDLSEAGLARLRCRMGFVPQLLPGRSEAPLTVREVVAIGRTGRAGLFRRLSRADWMAVDEWIERLGLAPLAQRAFGEISGGEQRKTIIARAMAQEPEVLLLDEPTANLDLGWRERIVDTIDRLFAERRLTIILVCHELEVLPPCCHQVGVLEGGSLTSWGPPAEVLTTARVARLYGNGLQVIPCAGRFAVVPEGGPRA